MGSDPCNRSERARRKGWGDKRKRVQIHKNNRQWELTKMFEYHVDSLKMIKPESVTTNLGGNLSTRFPELKKPLVIFDHDECIFKQYTMPMKQWYGPNREPYVVPKDDGMGVMISAFQSQEFGFGLVLTNEDPQKSEWNKGGQKIQGWESRDRYKERGPWLQEATYQISLHSWIQIRANSEGYWTYQHIAGPFEDCDDVLKVVYPQYEFLFLFDHSCGHNRRKEDGLSVEKMTKGRAGHKKVWETQQSSKQNDTRNSRMDGLQELLENDGWVAKGCLQKGAWPSYSCAASKTAKVPGAGALHRQCTMWLQLASNFKL